MAGEQILLDPTSEGTGTQLDITDSTLGYFLLEHSYPTPDNDEVWAYSTDTEGERRANTRPKNRMITAKVRCIQPAGGTPTIGTIVSALQGKIGKLNREGGTYKRILPSGDTITFQVLAATIQVPSDKQWLTAKKADVTLTFTCAPYGLGLWTTLTAHTETTAPVIVFTETGIKGDVPAIGRLVVTDAQNQNQKFAVWGIQSRYYDSAATAALFFEAESTFTISNQGSVNTGPSGASGSSTLLDGALRTGAWDNVMEIGTNTSPPRSTHKGRFRVFARVQVPATNAGTVSMRLAWVTNFSFGTLNQKINSTVTLDPSWEGTWRLVDLGQVDLTPTASIAGNPPLGWTGLIQALSTVANDDIYVDYAFLVPIDEGTGQASQRSSGIGPIMGDRSMAVTSDGVFFTFDFTGTLSWTPVDKYQGDYLLIPPAGTEGRTTRVIVKASRGALTTDADTGVDDITAQLIYRPRYLAVPAP